MNEGYTRFAEMRIRLCYRKVKDRVLYHVIVPEGDRISYKTFLSLKDYLKKELPYNFTKDLYLAGVTRWYEEGKPLPTKDQWVFEYATDFNTLSNYVRGFLLARPTLTNYNFTFTEQDYDMTASLKEVPKELLAERETVEKNEIIGESND